MLTELFYPTNLDRYFKGISIARIIALAVVSFYLGLELSCAMCSGYHWDIVVVCLLLVVGLTISLTYSILCYIDNFG
jgi:hypothetical protein